MKSAIIIDRHDAFVKYLYSAFREHDVDCEASFAHGEHALDYLKWADVKIVYVSIDCLSVDECERLRALCASKDINIVSLTGEFDSDELQAKKSALGAEHVFLKSNDVVDELFPKNLSKRSRSR